MYEGPPILPEDFYSVYVIFNGMVAMTPGKMAAQAFHCGRLLVLPPGILCEEPFRSWDEQGCCVRVRMAETPHVFQRVMDECEGVAQQDEGLTEVERGTITAYVTIPYRPAEAPKILNHKKLRSSIH